MNEHKDAQDIAVEKLRKISLRDAIIDTKGWWYKDGCIGYRQIQIKRL